MICVGVRQQPELLGETEAVVQVFWGHKVLGDLDTAVEVLDLVGRPRGDEYGIPHTLYDGVAQHPVLLIQTILELHVQVPALVVNRVMVGLYLLPSLLAHLFNIKTILSMLVTNRKPQN